MLVNLSTYTDISRLSELTVLYNIILSILITYSYFWIFFQNNNYKNIIHSRNTIDTYTIIQFARIGKCNKKSNGIQYNVKIKTFR